MDAAWFALLGSLTGAVLGYVGAILTAVVNRSGLCEIDHWRRREETMRLIRWASELAVRGDTREAKVGLGALDALQ